MKYKLSVRRKVVNGREFVTYPFKGVDARTVAERLYTEFTTQGQFYLDKFGVSLQDAEDAGWDPHESDFFSLYQGHSRDGWNRFIKDNGVIDKTETIETEEIELT